MIFSRLKTLSFLVNKCVCTKGMKEVSIDIAFDYFYSFLQNSSMNYVIGNGGSAGIASHFCTDLLKTLKLPSVVLTDASIMTCMANDFGYENVFSEPLKVILKENNLVIAISSSGKSQNIISAIKIAKQMGAKVVTLSGFLEDNAVRQLGDINFWLGVSDYGLVEIGHFFILHTIVDLWNKRPLSKMLKYAHKNKNIWRIKQIHSKGLRIVMSWSFWYNRKVGAIYHLSLDNDVKVKDVVEICNFMNVQMRDVTEIVEKRLGQDKE